MSNTERRQTGGRVGGSNFSASQSAETSAKDKTVNPKTTKLTDSPSVFGNTIKFTKTIPRWNT